MIKRTVLLCLAGALLACPLAASETRWWIHSSQTDFGKGELKGTSVTSDGRLIPAPILKETFDTGEAFVYAAVADAVGNIYLGTGNNGKVFRVTPSGSGSAWADAGEAGVFALALDSTGRVYAATSPEGKIYRFNASGEREVFFEPKEKYIWSLAFDKQNNLYAGTGPRGRVYKIAPNGQGDVFYDSGEGQIVRLAWDLDGNLLCGTAPGGLVLRIAAGGRAEVLYDSPLQEIKAITVDRYGLIYAAALDSTSDTAPAAPAAESGENSSASDDDDTVRTAGTERGKGLEIYRIDRSRMVERLYASNEDIAFDLSARSDGNLLVATGTRGRILAISPDRQVTLLVESPEEQITGLLDAGGRTWAVSSNLGKLFELRTSSSEPGIYESGALDAGLIAKWGLIRWTLRSGDVGVKVYSRSGNTEKADATWSDWSAAYVSADGSAIQSPPARYLQYKVEFPPDSRSGSPTSPNQALHLIAISYRQNNMAPRFVSLTVNPPGKALAAVPGGSSAGTQPGGPDGVHVDSLPREMRRLDTSIQPPPRSVFVPGARSFQWECLDPNDDPLVYSLYLQRDGEIGWKPLRPDWKEDYYTLDGAGLADGTYRLKVIASDRVGNPKAEALTSELVSKSFIVSSVGLELQLAAPEVSGKQATLRFSVTSKTAFLHQAEYQLNGGEWQVVLPEDGITDGRSESYVATIEDLSAGENIVNVRVIDSVGNIAAERRAFRGN